MVTRPMLPSPLTRSKVFQTEVSVIVFSPIVQSDGCTSVCGNVGYTGSYTANIGKSSFSSTPTKVEIATMNGAVIGAVIVNFLGQTYSVSGDETVTIT